MILSKRFKAGGRVVLERRDQGCLKASVRNKGAPGPVVVGV